MSIAPGERLGHYDVLAAIGTGGMGDVYKAHDSRLRRDVAIKVSREQFTERFAREARVVASLNHPNICTVFDVGPNYLVMELIDGDTLADRIRQGPIPREEAVRIAGQIAEALRAAHEKGVTHRDLKPGNIKIRHDGTVKVLDFGLARVGGIPGASSDDSPTLTLDATLAGAILGTAAYMSPEQARGRPVDKRADIYAFGVVFYEMVTGERLHQGESVSETLADVIRQEPALWRVPLEVRRLLASCLKKDPQQRLQDIADWKLLLDTPPAAVAAPAGVQADRRYAWVAGAAGVLLAALAFVHFREMPVAPPPLTRFLITPPTLASGIEFYMAMSPDGRRLAYTAMDAGGIRKIFVHRMDTIDSLVLPGTDDARGLFWSPDSRYIAFGSNKALKKVDASGASPPRTLCEIDALVGIGTWSPDDVIVFGGRGPGQGGMRRVSAAGGDATPLTIVPTEQSAQAYPVFLPDGKHFLYLALSLNVEVRGIYSGSIDVKPEQQPTARLLATSLGVAFIPGDGGRPAHLLVQRESTLMAQPFDPARIALSGDPVRIEEKIGAAGSSGYFAGSGTTLAYRTSSRDSGLVWLDRTGTHREGVGQPGAYREITLSSDGGRVAVYRADGQDDVWVLDLADRDRTDLKLTSATAVERAPVWSPDGDSLAYAAATGIYRKAANGTGEAELVLASSPELMSPIPLDWSRDDKYLLLRGTAPSGSLGLWVLPLQGERKPSLIVTTVIGDVAAFSPDGRWIVYSSLQATNTEIFVRPFVPPGSNGTLATTPWPVSSGGGLQPRWRGDSKEILYLSPTLQMMSVDVTSSGDSFQATMPKLLFTLPAVPVEPGSIGASGWRWAMTSDASRFLVNAVLATRDDAPITIVENWQRLLTR